MAHSWPPVDTIAAGMWPARRATGAAARPGASVCGRPTTNHRAADTGARGARPLVSAGYHHPWCQPATTTHRCQPATTTPGVSRLPPLGVTPWCQPATTTPGVSRLPPSPGVTPWCQPATTTPGVSRLLPPLVSAGYHVWPFL